MEILFTTSDKPMSKLIRWATGECCSHTAIRLGDLVIHSDSHGVNGVHIDDFLEENRIIHVVTYNMPATEVLSKMDSLKDHWYDVGALLFCGVMLFCRKALGLRKWPKQNLWQASGMYMCTEFVTEVINNEADALITPHQLYERIK